MVRTTRAQRRALKAVFDRDAPMYRAKTGGFTYNLEFVREDQRTPVSYRTFRRAVHAGYDCIMIKWCGMWLGIEPDGYTHS